VRARQVPLDTERSARLVADAELCVKFARAVNRFAPSLPGSFDSAVAGKGGPKSRVTPTGCPAAVTFRVSGDGKSVKVSSVVHEHQGHGAGAGFRPAPRMSAAEVAENAAAVRNGETTVAGLARASERRSGGVANRNSIKGLIRRAGQAARAEDAASGVATAAGVTDPQAAEYIDRFVTNDSYGVMCFSFPPNPAVLADAGVNASTKRGARGAGPQHRRGQGFSVLVAIVPGVDEMLIVPNTFVATERARGSDEALNPLVRP